MSSGSATAQGSRPYQEDRWLCHAHPPGAAEPGGTQPRFSIAAVYDGHGGAAASEYSVQNLHAHLCGRLPPRMSEQLGASSGAAADPAPLPSGAVESALAEAFADTEAGFMTQAMAEGQNDGTTATVVVVEPGERRLFTAQLGDSRAVLGFIDNEETAADGREEEPESDSLDFSRLTGAAASAGDEQGRDSKRRRVDPAPVKMGAVRLTQDHKPQDATERQRVEAAGGEVVFLGCWRVSHPDCTSYLACSRAIGDLSLKVPAAVVSCERHTHPAHRTLTLGLLTRASCAAVPDTTVRELRPDIDQFVIVASDGLWDVFQDREAVEFAAAAMAEAAADTEGKEGEGGAELQRAATALVKAALERGSEDNVTAVVVGLGWGAAG